MAIWQYDIVAVPRGPINLVCGGFPTDIQPELFDSRNWWRGKQGPDDTELSALLPPAISWSESIKAWGTNDGNRIELHFHNEELFEIKIRIDLRELSKKFLEAIIELAVRHDLVFWTEEARLLEASFDALASDIAKSQALSFVHDPRRFLDQLSKQQTE